MIDNFTLLFTTLMIVYVLVRAAALDRKLPWFQTRAMYDQEQQRLAAGGPKSMKAQAMGAQQMGSQKMGSQHGGPQPNAPQAWDPPARRGDPKIAR